MSIPRKDSLLVPWSTNANTRLIASGVTTYKLLAAQVTNYTAVHTPYVTAYNTMMTAREAGERSESLTAITAAARLALLNVARPIYTQIQSDPAVSDSDKILLGVHVRLAPSPVPPPATAPGVDVISVNVRTVSLRVHDSAIPARRGKPAGASAAYIYSFVGAEFPADPSAWNFEGATTTPRFDIVFPSTLAGGTQVWVCAAWVNRKQQSGPTSVPISTTLQGGGLVEGTMLKVAA